MVISQWCMCIGQLQLQALVHLSLGEFQSNTYLCIDKSGFRWAVVQVRNTYWANLRSTEIVEADSGNYCGSWLAISMVMS